MKNIFFYLVVSGFILSCQSTDRQSDRVAKLPPALALEITSPGGAKSKQTARALTANGENSEGVFSPDGSHILFVSRGRTEHAQGQLYELSLIGLREKRVTYQDGDIRSPFYHPDGVRIVYASTTDSMKEDPVFVEALQKNYGSPADAATVPLTNMYDLYISQLDGRDIRRFAPTFRSSNADAVSIAVSPNGHKAAFASSSRGSKAIDIFTAAIEGHDVTRVTTDPDIQTHPRFSPDGKYLVWSKTNAADGSSQLALMDLISRKIRTLTVKSAQHFEPSWNPNSQEIVFSSNRENQSDATAADATGQAPSKSTTAPTSRGFDLYIYDLKASCIKRLTDTPFDERFPVFSPDGKRLIFSSNASGLNQIYLIDYQPPESCLQDAP